MRKCNLPCTILCEIVFSFQAVTTEAGTSKAGRAFFFRSYLLRKSSNAAKASISTGDLWIFCSFESMGLDIKLRESVLDEALEFDETARDLRIL